MMRNVLLVLTLGLCLSCLSSKGIEPENEVKISREELKLYNLINDYRKTKNLQPIPLSKSLTFVAQQHSKDLVINKPDSKQGCNSHSWSNKGNWTSCCYTSDHKQAECMWNKPREMTSYKDTGFEIAAGSSQSNNQLSSLTAAYALDLWKKSRHHDDVILNRETWKDFEWKAIGVGIYQGVATVWFGSSLDTEGEPAK
jgi:uncharacterized protein YkwD